MVQFDVIERPDTDEDDDSRTTIVPFQIAYAVSIHKAQGLEFDSVKVVITEANEENISHSIFYTAITRARKHLEVYWTPDTQNRILGRLEVRENKKDENLLRQRRRSGSRRQRAQATEGASKTVTAWGGSLLGLALLRALPARWVSIARAQARTRFRVLGMRPDEDVVLGNDAV